MSVTADLDVVMRRVAAISGDAVAPAPAPFAVDGSAFAKSRRAPDAPAFARMIERGAAEAHVDPSLVAAVAQTESAFDPMATSRTGAAGIMQLMPDTARSLGVTDPYDPAANIRGGAKYLRELLDRFGGDVRLAVAAYNAGPGAVERYGSVPPFAETQEYVARVLSAFEARTVR